MKLPILSMHVIFRIACAMCFIGHGIFGFITKAVWCNYFGVFGIGEYTAYQLMPMVGFVDVLMGIVLLVYPLRIAAAWLVFWGLFTALLRPLSGEPFAEFLERAGNYGAPMILLLLSLPSQENRVGWFARLVPKKVLAEDRSLVIRNWLQVFGFLLMVGHGWLNLIDKQGLLNQYSAMGFEDPAVIATVVGAFECIGALLILIWPSRALVMTLLVWKVASEIWYPSYAILEWIERGGSYAVLLGLWIMLSHRYTLSNSILYFGGGRRVSSPNNPIMP